MIRNVIFDLDGTLVDSALICAEILTAMLADRGCPRRISAEEATPFLSLGGTHMVSGLLAAQCGDPHVEIAEFRSRYAAMPTPPNSLYPGVRTGLRALSALGLELAICSNKPQNLCEKVLAELGLARLVPVVVGGAPDRRPKPDPHLMELTLAELGADPQHCLFIGDSELDHAVSQATGVPFLFVRYGYADPDWVRTGLLEFTTFSDLVDRIRLAMSSPPGERRAA